MAEINISDPDAAVGNQTKMWLVLAGFTFVYALITVISLKFIDKDKQ